MASKTISVKEATYERLARAKGESESFSDVIDRLLRAETDRHPLYDLVGLLEEAEVETLRARADAFRQEVDGRMESPQ